MGQSLCHIYDVSVPTNGTFFNRIARTGAGGSYRIGFITVFALWRVFYLSQTTASADIKHLTVYLTVSVPDYNLLHSVTQRVQIVPLFHLAAVYAEVSVIAQSQTAWCNAFYQRKVMVISTGVTAAATAVAILILAVTIRIAAAAGAAGFRFSLIPQPYIGHAAFHHFSAVIVFICYLVIYRILTLVGKVGSAGFVTAIRRQAIANRSPNPSLR
jgi:hypothetical protein